MTEKHPAPYHLLWLGLILAIYTALLFPTLGYRGISWDEQTDINIARFYTSPDGGWLADSGDDPCNTRLPMYLVAIVFSLSKNHSLFTARAASFFAGALAIIAVYIFCKKRYSLRKAALASSILATSPYFLSFSRVAFTESDIYVTCALAWLLAALAAFEDKKNLGRAAIVAVVLGLALSAKISAIAIFPAVGLWILFLPEYRPGAKNAGCGKRKPAAPFILMALLAALIFGGWEIHALGRPGVLRAIHYSAVFILWLSIVAYAVRNRSRSPGRFTVTAFVLLFSFFTFLVIPPPHTTNPLIFHDIRHALFSDYLGGLNLPYLLKIASLHISSVLFKPSLIIGAILWLALLASVFSREKRKRSALILMIFAFYFIFLLKMPWAQSFYMMPLFPILAILASDQFLDLYDKKRFAAIAVGLSAAVILIRDIILCYPDYNLNGFQYVGERYIAGMSTIGSRSIVQTTSDGVEQSLQWLNSSVPAGKSVVAYIRPAHIIEANCPNPKFKLTVADKNDIPLSVLASADYVVTTIDTDIERGYGKEILAGDIYRYPYDIAFLKKNFVKVFSVKRAFGLEFAGVWQKKR